MQRLSAVVVDVEVLLALEPEELGAKMLFFMRSRADHKVHLGNFVNELWPSSNPADWAYPENRRVQIGVAIAEAWAWLEAQGLLIPEPGVNGHYGWRLLSRRAQKFEDETEFKSYAV